MISGIKMAYSTKAPSGREIKLTNASYQTVRGQSLDDDFNHRAAQGAVFFKIASLHPDIVKWAISFSDVDRTADNIARQTAPLCQGCSASAFHQWMERL